MKKRRDVFEGLSNTPIRTLTMKRTFTALLCILTIISAYAQVPKVRLSNGVEMPEFGIGTFNVPSDEACKDAVLTALRADYRHIDTAHAYMDVALWRS